MFIRHLHFSDLGVKFSHPNQAPFTCSWFWTATILMLSLSTVLNQFNWTHLL